MKLIVETLETDQRTLVEAAADGTKQYFIEGRWATADEKNKNRRVYPRPVLESAVDKYVRDYVAKNRALSELGHPQGPTVNLDRASHKIERLVMEGNYVNGRGKILNTPMGNIAKGLIDEGVVLGVSTRGLGTVIDKSGIKEVQSDFWISAIDIVSDPSGPGCFVNGIMEDAEWVQDALGNWVQVAKQVVEQVVVDTKYDRALREAKYLAAMNRFLLGL